MNGLARLFLSVFFVLTAFLPYEAAGAEPQEITVKDLAVEGNRRVQEAVILARVQTKVGSLFVPGRLAEDIRAIFGLGFFDDVQLKVEDFEGGVKITFVVVERPFVRDIVFRGNKRVTLETLEEKVDLKLGVVYNPVEVRTALEKLKAYYEEQGHFEVQLTPDVEKLPGGDVRIVFQIVEGRRIKIERIVIEGAEGISEKKLKRIMATRERQYFIFRGVVQRQQLDLDAERILSYYSDHGYIQARVESTDLQVDRARARVTIKIVVVEGPQFSVGTVDVTGTNLLSEEEVRRQILLTPGDVFSRQNLRQSVNQISALYDTIGRASAEVRPLSTETAERTINLRFEINEGPQVFVERINISGNVRSQEKILRREVPMAEGDLFTSVKLLRARQRLINLGYFDSVRVRTAPGSTRDKIIVNIEVRERPTGLFSIGGAFSSTDGVLGTFDLSQRNFLGRGWELGFRARIGFDLLQGTLSFTEPWLFDRPLSAGFDLFNNRREFVDYTQEDLGGAIRFSHPFLDFARWHLTYSLTRDEISDVSDLATDTLKDAEGSSITSLVRGSLSRDTRDNVFAPTRGTRASLVVDVAGLGGDNEFMIAVANVSAFYPVRWGTVLAGRLEGGYGFGFGDQELPLFERFFLGGPNSIRGHDFRSISPRDDGGARTGGTSEVLFSVEYIVPIFFGIRLAAFFDAGNAYGFTTDFDLTETREAAGVGLRWRSPFGPVRVDWGFNLDQEDGESASEIHFTAGSAF